MSGATNRGTTNPKGPNEDSFCEERIHAGQEWGLGPIPNHPARRVNCHGVFLEIDVHLRMTGERAARTRAEIRVIEDITGWYVATSWTLEKGQHRGSSAPLSIHGEAYSSKEEALEEGKERIIEATRQAAEHDHKSVEKAKQEVAEVHNWVRKAVKRPEWFDHMTPGEYRLKDKEGSRDDADESATEQSGKQESLF